jgi:hypothetical protein
MLMKNVEKRPWTGWGYLSFIKAYYVMITGNLIINIYFSMLFVMPII